MTKLITTYEGTDYTMEFDRSTVMQTEEQLGLSMDDLKTPSITTRMKLFYGSLLKHHPRIKSATVDKLYEGQPDKGGLFIDLMEMYSDAYLTLIEDPAEGKALPRRKE